MEEVLDRIPGWPGALLVFLLAAIVALGIHALLFYLWSRFTTRHRSAVSAALLAAALTPTRFIFPLLSLLFASLWVRLPPALTPFVEFVVTPVFIAALAWLSVRLIVAVIDLAALRLRVDEPDNLAARTALTQIQLLQRITVAAIVVIAAAWILSLFPVVEGLGTTLFASAGIAGIVIGIAARPTLSNLIAGIQIALTKSIRIYDAVVVEGEWGWVEEITMTHVVVRIWDWRRLVVPISYFVEKPFENWTRPTAHLLGEVFIHADYTLPIDPLREEFLRILQSTDLWDGKSHVLQVTDATERTIQIRALMSASNSPRAFDLRCHVREQLIRFIQQSYPKSLPRVRAEIEQSE